MRNFEYLNERWSNAGIALPSTEDFPRCGEADPLWARQREGFEAGYLRRVIEFREIASALSRFGYGPAHSLLYNLMKDVA